MNATLIQLLLPLALSSGDPGIGAPAPAPSEPPEIPFGYDAFLEWEKWPSLRIGVRAYMKSTFDRTGGNYFADAAHYIRQSDDDHSVALDEVGPGILWFVRHNHWHGSPWRYNVDGRETVVRESSTEDPTRPVPGSVFLPRVLFPHGLTWTWSVTKGADLSWVPIPFEKSLELAYGRTRYGTGYFIFWRVMPGAKLSRPLESWTEQSIPPAEVLKLLGRSGTDIAPRGPGVKERAGRLSIALHETRTVVHLESGPSVLRRLAFRVALDGADALARCRLRIWWDGRAQPSIDAPLGLFFGAGSLMRDPGQEYIVKSFPMTVRVDEEGVLFATYFPMPFLESARIELAGTDGKGVTGVEWSLRHVPQTEPDPAMAHFHATYRDFPHPVPGRELVLLDTRRAEGEREWCGHLVGTTYIFTQSGTLNTLEGDPRFFFDDSRSPQVQGTGSEEWGGGGDYWGGRTMTLPFAGHPVGRPPRQAKTELDRLHSAYRFLLSDLMPFGRRAVVTLEHGGTNTSKEHYETVTYWYGVDQPGLILTDVLDVGDRESEKLHSYHSPEASEVELLVSRFELGVDHIRVPGGRGRLETFPAESDHGRRTKTFSEFTLKLKPRNLGVLLRRRLDLAYPDQKARVLVEKDGSWMEAGVWYTAGGNTVVFGDPLALPRESLKTHPELASPAHIVKTSNRRFREDEFMIPRALTAGRESIRVRLERIPMERPLFPGHPLAEEAWTELHYWAYCFVLPWSSRDR